MFDKESSLLHRQRSVAKSNSAQSFSQTPVFRHPGESIAARPASFRRPRHMMERDVKILRCTPSKTNASKRRNLQQQPPKYLERLYWLQRTAIDVRHMAHPVTTGSCSGD